MKHALKEVSIVGTLVWEDLLAFSMRLIVLELASIDGSIWKLKVTFSVLLTVLPFTRVRCPIRPLADSIAIHLAMLPLTIVLPSLILADEQPGTLLVPLNVLSFVIVPVGPLSNAQTLRNAVKELPDKALFLSYNELSLSMHFAT